MKFDLLRRHVLKLPVAAMPLGSSHARERGGGNMQPPVPVLSVVTYPPGATNTQQRIVIDGVRGAIFEYAAGGPTGALVSSWASKAGTDPYTNAYPQGFNAGPGSSFTGTDYIINSQGVFFYSGAPALGNLILSNTPASGTDAFGNAYLIGVTNYTPGTTYFAEQLYQASVLFYNATSGAGPWTQVGSILCPGGASGMQFQSSPGGFTFGGGALLSVAGTATSPTLITTDSWHNMTLLNSWANNASFVASRYKLMENKSVRVQGVINATAATNNTFFTLPLGYRPTSPSGAPVGVTAGAAAGIVPQLRWDTAGNLSISNLTVPVTSAIFFTQDIPLD